LPLALLRFSPFRSSHIPCSTLFPYTTLFRSMVVAHQVADALVGRHGIAALVAVLDGAAVVGAADGAGDSPGGRNAGTDHIAVLEDRKSTRLNSSHVSISYAVFCLNKKNISY